VNRTTYPALWQFLGAYLHQDWRHDYPDTRSALSGFMTGEPAVSPTLVAEIERLLATTHSSAETEAAILELGSFFVPSATGEDPRGWLLHMRDEASRMGHSDPDGR
jgi:CdiI immunity protein